MIELKVYAETPNEIRHALKALLGDEAKLFEAGRQAGIAEASEPRTSDEAALKAAREQAESFTTSTPIAGGEVIDTAPKKRGRPAKAKTEEPEPSIRANPENREPPADEQDPPEVQAQDAADEAAELDPVPENDVTSMFDEDDGAPVVEIEPEVTAVDIKTALGAWHERTLNKPAEKQALHAYKGLFASLTDGKFTTLKDLTEKGASPEVLRTLLAAVQKQDVK